jgi:hypothetical protein
MSLTQLTALKTSFDPEAIAQKEQWLSALLSRKKFRAKELAEVIDLLLFFRAHPHSIAFAQRTDKALSQLHRLIRQSGLKHHPELIAEGLSGVTVTSQFSPELIQWIGSFAPKNMTIDSFGADENTQQEIISRILPAAEREYFESSDEPTADEWLKRYAGKQSPLQCLAELFNTQVTDASMRTWLFSKLDLFVKLHLQSPIPGRSETRGLTHPPFVHTEPLLRKINAQEIIAQPIGRAIPLSDEDRRQLIAAKRFHLASLGRETDPGTYADIRDVQLYDMGRGMHIALYGMDPEHRLPLDAYIGFMAFKNQLPYAYGGAWMLGSNAKIGINIFPPFRGGESAWFFAQLIRLYHQAYKPTVFQAEPYQLGKDNPEGLESGAFWFYYRLGFRPRKPALQSLAKKESEKIAKDKSYRTSLRTLEQLVDDEVVLELSPTPSRTTREASKHASGAIRQRFGGSRQQAMSWVKNTYHAHNGFNFSKDLSSAEQQRLDDWLMFFLDDPAPELWSADRKRLFTDAAMAKVRGTDSDYALLLHALQHEHTPI